MTAVADSYSLAVKLHRSGDLEKAERLYRQVVRLDPAHSDALHQLGLVEHGLRRHVAAVDLIGHAIDINAEVAPYWISLGKVYRSLNQSDRAIAAFQQAMRLEPKNCDAYVNLGLLLSELAEPRGAEACYRQALRIDSGCSEAAAQLVRIQYANGQTGEALAEVRRLLSVSSDGCEDICAIATELEQRRQFDDALEVYETVLEVHPDFAEAIFGIAHVLLSLQKLEESRDWYVKGLSIRQSHCGAWTNLGCIQSVLNEPEAAAECFQNAVAADSESIAAHYNLGNSYASRGFADEAIASYRRALELDHRHAGALRNLGNVLVGCGSFAEAEASYRRALDVEPKDAGTLVNLAHALKEQNRLDEAIDCFGRSLNLHPANAAAHYSLGRTQELAGKTDDAIVSYQNAIDQNSADAQSRYHLGILLKNTGRFEDAIQTLQEARRLDPGHVLTVYQLGNVYRHMKRYDDARQAYEEVLSHRPDDFETMISLGNVLKAQDDLPGAAARYRTVLNHLPDQPLWRLWVATLCPIVFHSTVGIDDYRRHLTADLNRLARKNLRIEPRDITQCGCPPPYALQFHGRDDRPLKEAYARVFENCLQPEIPRPRNNKPRVGFVVTDGHEGVFLRYLGEIVDRLNPALFETTIICSAGGKARIESDARPPRARLLVVPTRFDQIVDAIRAEQFDILYHWEVGSDVTNYFLPFFRLAPVQCTGNGLPVTSGIPQIDYFISDGVAEPRRAERHYSERLVRFRSTTTLQRRLPPAGVPKTREDFGISADRHLYVCPHKIEKFHPEIDEVFRDILRRDPDGVIVIPKDREGYAARKLRGRLQLTAPDVIDRIRFVPYQTLQGYLSLTSIADVLLDPLHYGGGLTTFDGFSLNQPIVTLPGEFLRGRFTAGFYERMGVTECIANSPEQYAEIAVRIASNEEFRDELRAKIRDGSSVLFDDASVVGEYEEHFLKWIDESRQR
ncbi:MAG: tetratricopeptide repeat protein [Planctomycetaceae bacterium]